MLSPAFTKKTQRPHHEKQAGYEKPYNFIAGRLSQGVALLTHLHYNSRSCSGSISCNYLQAHRKTAIHELTCAHIFVTLHCNFSNSTT